MNDRTHLNTRHLPALLVGAGAFVLGSVVVAGDFSSAMGRDDHRIDDDALLIVEEILEEAAACGDGDDDGSDEIELESLKFFIEFNETDEDIGVQTVLGGEPYKVLKAYDPDELRILDLRPRRSLRQQGLSDFFFESAEPALDEFSLAEFLDRFPEGEYEFETVTLDDIEQDGEAVFTHTIPAGPVITSPSEGDVVDVDDVVICWEPVTLTTAFNPPQVPVKIVGYQVILTREDPLRVLAMDVSPETTSVSIPPEYLDPGTEYEVEVLAVEASDNQTISLLFFETDE